MELHQFEKRLAQVWDPATWRDVNVVVAVSGGADSVALLLALQRMGQQTTGQLVAAHLNHNLRGAESDGDQQFVQQLCQQLDVPCETRRCAEPVSSTGDGLEAGARRQRYEFFRQASRRWGARFVATAHTADDQAETILHRVVRGTGIAGLGGVPFVRSLSEMTTVIRPMLSVTRDEVQAYLDSRGQIHREDSTNQMPAFTRNRIRHQLLPLLTDFNPQVVQSLLRLGALAREAQEVINAAVEPLLEASVIFSSPERVELRCAPLRCQRPYLVREMLMRIWAGLDWPRQDMAEGKWNQVGALVRTDRQPAAGFTLPGNIQAQVREDVLILSRC